MNSLGPEGQSFLQFFLRFPLTHQQFTLCPVMVPLYLLMLAETRKLLLTAEGRVKLVCLRVYSILECCPPAES